MDEKIKILQKNGEFHFQGVTREDSRRQAEKLILSALHYDQKNGILCRYKIVQDDFGYYYVVAFEFPK